MVATEIFKGIIKLVDKIYERFILRDIFAKIIPGLLFLSAVQFFIEGKFTIVIKISHTTWIVVIGFAWILAFGIQSLGEWIKHYHIYDKKLYKDNDEWNEAGIAFRAKASRHDKSVYNRLAVIKEATGTLGLAIIMSTILVAARLLNLEWKLIMEFDFLFSVIICILFALLLIRMHRVHARRQSEYVSKVNSMK